jgi:hypothetical protein
MNNSPKSSKQEQKRCWKGHELVVDSRSFDIEKSIGEARTYSNLMVSKIMTLIPKYVI